MKMQSAFKIDANNVSKEFGAMTGFCKGNNIKRVKVGSS